MSDTTERVGTRCPSCSPDEQTVHEVLKPGGQATVRCTECSHVHKIRIEEERTVQRDVVVSQEGDSFSATAEPPADEQLASGEEFVLDTPEAIMTVRITSLELESDKRVDEASAEDVSTIWTRAVGNVGVKTTIHPQDGRRDESKSVTLQVPGDYEFTVGATEEHGEEEFSVEGIAVRDDATGYEFDKLDRDRDTAVAKDIKRLYVRDETTTAWSAW
ncbi:HVO_0476 family zinc finger protein [Natronoarchaeum sp. GCM10025703]|uniref:HVO_0476 family zinc finger protein n=1 Tax=unclassified Natronoarchaeum TaxID=2620183 RepID=UPI00362183E9